jgi:predicted RND superfamily exporter protein
MTVSADDLDAMPVVPRLEDFDTRSGNWLERLIFNNRLPVILACVIATIVLGYFAATKLVFNASFEKMIPQSQPYIKNYLENKADLRGLGNAIRVVVENIEGDIYNPEYLQTLQLINDELTLTTGVDRAWVKSLWTPGGALAGSDRRGLRRRSGDA